MRRRLRKTQYAERLLGRGHVYRMTEMWLCAIINNVVCRVEAGSGKGANLHEEKCVVEQDSDKRQNFSLDSAELHRKSTAMMSQAS